VSTTAATCASLGLVDKADDDKDAKNSTEEGGQYYGGWKVDYYK
jgi:hypothetical protein